MKKPGVGDTVLIIDQNSAYRNKTGTVASGPNSSDEYTVTFSELHNPIIFRFTQLKIITAVATRHDAVPAAGNNPNDANVAKFTTRPPLLKQIQIAAGFLPINLAAGDNDGDYVSMNKYDKLVALFYKNTNPTYEGGASSASSAAAEDTILTLTQAKTAAGGSAKALDFDTIYTKQGDDLFNIGQWTKVTQAADNTYTNSSAAEDELLWAIEIDRDDLDLANGFEFVRAAVSDVGASVQLGCLLYIAGDPRYPADPESMPSILA